MWVSGETGLMSLEVDPDFATTGRFYTCQGAPTAGGGHDVRVVAWRYDDAAHTATRVRDLLTGLPSRTGRHGGCRLLVLRDGSMVVGTGDAAVGTNPRDLRSLGGKTLRLDPATGAPWPGNPFAGAANRNKRYVQTYGHRNVQGLGQRRDGSVWSVEQGTYRDDEVNRLRPGGDYGYHPVPGYNEKVPMTNPRLPGPQRAARWRSGDPTMAVSGGSWVYGEQWGALDGTFAVAALKAQRVVFLRFDAAGRLQSASTPAALRQFGRLRSITQAADGDLLVTTDNGNGTATRSSGSPPAPDPADRAPAGTHHARPGTLQALTTRRPGTAGTCRHSQAVHPSQRPPALRARNQSTTANAATPGTQVGCAVHQTAARTSRATQTSSRSTTAHQGASSPLAAYRKNAQAIPAMPTNGHGDVALRLRRRRRAKGTYPSGLSSFQAGSFSHAWLRSSALASAPSASSREEYGPSRSMAGQPSSPSTAWCLTQYQ